MKWDIIFWLVFIMAIATVLWYLFGDSPTMEQVLLMLVLGMAIKNGFAIQKNTFTIEKTNGRIELIEKQMAVKNE